MEKQNNHIPQIQFADYIYDLPEEKIAKFPLEKRDQSKLLFYNKGIISHQHFYNLPQLLPEKSFLFFNNTKVIPARLYFRRDTGAFIEIFLLNPQVPHLVADMMQAKQSCVWECMIGNKKKWKHKEVLIQKISIQDIEIELKAVLIDSQQQWVKFEWNSDLLTFAEIMQYFGEIPLPPYLNRKVTDKDKQQYQTVYSKNEGAVAAPTAGLHFTEEVLKGLAEKGIGQDFITLHVSAGTFQPIKAEEITGHQMHSEQMIFTKSNIENLLDNIGNIIAVGTTSMRALESLYYIGLSLMMDGKPMTDGNGVFTVPQFLPYQIEEKEEKEPSLVFEYLLQYLEDTQKQEIIAETKIFIFPTYRFKICKGIITNYHQPNSTLILLVAAFLGDDWRKVYEEALQNEYRFLSYGDSSLLIP